MPNQLILCIQIIYHKFYSSKNLFIDQKASKNKHLILKKCRISKKWQSYCYSYSCKLYKMNKLSCQTSPDDKIFDIDKCRYHRKANSYGMPLNYSVRCECCGKFAKKEELTLNFSLIKIYYCGPQLVSYLTILKYLSFLLFLLCLTIALPLMIINQNGNFCDKKLECSGSVLLYYSVFNEFNSHKKMAEESYIVFANFIVCIIFWHILRNQLNKIKTEIDQTNFIPSQYIAFCQLPMKNLENNVFVQGLQKWWKLEIKHNKKEMQKHFPRIFQPQSNKQNYFIEYQVNQQAIQRYDLQHKLNSQFVEKIIYSYDYADFQKKLVSIHNQKQLPQQQQKQNSLKTWKKNNKDSFNQFKLPLQLTNKNRYCLVLFKRSDYAEYFSKRNNPNMLQQLTCFQNFRFLKINKKKVNVISMHYPSQILWKNHHIQPQENRRLLLNTIIVLILIILSGSGFILLFVFLYQKFISLMSNYFNHIYYVVISLLINLMILIGNKIIQVYSEDQKHQTYVSQKSSFVYKIVVLNVCLILISPLLIFEWLNTKLLWQNNGFIETEVISLVIYMIAIHIQRYLSPSTLKIIRQHLDLQKKESQKDISQKEANKKFNKPSHKIDKQYAAICTITFINFFLSSYAPYIILISCVWMIIQYWIEKANISYFYNQDEFHSNQLGNRMVQLIEYSFSFLIYGNLSAYVIRIKYFQQKNQLNLLILFSILCTYTFFSFFLPHEKINRKLFSLFHAQQQSGDAQDSLSYSYQNLKPKFLELYEDYNDVLAYYTNKKKQLGNQTKTKQKQIDETQSIAVSLSLTLKQRLLNKNQPIFAQIKQKAHDNEEYFEYQKKIDMKKTKPKVDIPPLFKKDTIFKPQTLPLTRTKQGQY